MKTSRTIAVASLLAIISKTAFAMPISLSYSFNILDIDGDSAAGSFTGADGDMDNLLSAAEISAFEVTGTPPGGGDYTLSLPGANLFTFEFDIINEILELFSIVGDVRTLAFAKPDRLFDSQTLRYGVRSQESVTSDIRAVDSVRH